MLNRVTAIGNLGADPEIRRTQDGKPVASFSLAVTESWKDRSTGEKKEKTEWLKVVVFSEGLCKVIESYVSKGSKLYIEGKLQTRRWQDKEGKDRYSTEVVLQGFDSKLIMLSKSEGGSGGHVPPNDIDDEIPFNCERRI